MPSEKTFREQPDVMEHVQYCATLQERGVLVMGGRFLDDSGGMMILKIKSEEQALEAAEADPTVISGLLRVKVRSWMVPMSSIEA